MQDIKKATVEALANGGVIFALSLGLSITAKNAQVIQGGISYEFIIMQSIGLAAIRFSSYMIENAKSVSAGNVGDFIAPTDNREKSRAAAHMQNVAEWIGRYQVGKLI